MPAANMLDYTAEYASAERLVVAAQVETTDAPVRQVVARWLW